MELSIPVTFALESSLAIASAKQPEPVPISKIDKFLLFPATSIKVSTSISLSGRGIKTSGE